MRGGGGRMSKAKLTPEERAARKAAMEREKEIRERAEAEARGLWKNAFGKKALRGKPMAERRCAAMNAAWERNAVGNALVDLANVAGCLARILPAKTEAARAFVEAAAAFDKAAEAYSHERYAVSRAMNALLEASMVREIMREMGRKKREAARAEGVG